MNSVNRMLRPYTLVGVAIALLLFTACAQAPETVVTPTYTIDQFLDTTSMGGASFSPQGDKILVSSDADGVFNAYAIPVAGGDPVQLTHSTDNAIQVISYLPESERFLYSSDQGGDELNHVYLRDPDGTVTDLTAGENLKAFFGGWAKDRTVFYLLTNERDPRYFDVYEVVLDGLQKELVFQNDTGLQLGAVSRDGRYFALSKNLGDQDSDVYLYDRQDDSLENLTEHEGREQHQPAAFSPDGGSLFMLTDRDNEYQYLVRQDLETGDRSEILRPDWDIWYAYFSRTDKYLVVGINRDARTEIRVLDAETFEPMELPSLPEADITSITFSADDEQIAFYANASRYPSNLFVHEIGSAEPVQLTQNLDPEIESEHLVDGEVVRFSSYDGVEIPGILYRPKGASEENPAPALVWVHGGPGGQSRVGYSALIQYLVNHGYAVYAINNRGSTGYGKTFNKMDNQKHGEADLGDVVASKQMLIDTGWVDAERIGIIGGSYGGYMVLAALAFEPEVFDVGVDIFGVANWLRTLESIPPWWEAFRQSLYEEMGDPATDRERLERISPLFHAENIQKPLLVLQGANDPRVLQIESDEMVEAVRANGVPVEYIVFEDEGHGFLKKENRLEGYRSILVFLDQYLKVEGEAAT
ncbi:MAG: S9 family peptidase [Acidobacteriota bacterium]